MRPITFAASAHRGPWLKRIAAGLSFLYVFGGCYSAEQIKPAELPKLNGGFSEPIARTGNTTVVAVSVARVERPDGTLTEVRGRPDVELTLRSGETLTFGAPVLSEAEDDALVLRSENRAKTRVLFSNIEKAEVTQYDGTKTVLLMTGFALAIPLITLGVLVGTAKR